VALIATACPGALTSSAYCADTFQHPGNKQRFMMPPPSCKSLQRMDLQGNITIRPHSKFECMPEHSICYQPQALGNSMRGCNSDSSSSLPRGLNCPLHLRTGTRSTHDGQRTPPHDTECLLTPSSKHVLSTVRGYHSQRLKRTPPSDSRALRTLCMGREKTSFIRIQIGTRRHMPHGQKQCTRASETGLPAQKRILDHKQSA